MSSYNENLHSSVISSLNTQELELQSVEGKLEASMLSLYYAQGARITTAEEVEITTAKYAFEKKIHEEAIIDSDVSTNVLKSANNAKEYSAKSVSNTAVAAANVQIAANAILKLASDAGSIFSIINAADFDTDIYAQSNKAYVLMNDTAYAAEKASQDSMEASALIAEVTTNTLADKATVTDTSVKDLLSVVTKQFDATTTLLSTQSAALATSNTKEKQAEGVLEDYSVGYNATEEAYNLNNSELNLDLKVAIPITIGDHNSYTVSFNNYKSAFNVKSADGKDKPIGYPVQNYYIMLVENSKSGTFSMNDAEGIVTQGDAKRYVEITPNTSNTNGIIQKIYTSGKKTLEKPVLQDSEGKSLELGKEYVVFVLVTFTTAYKRIINTFDDYLSAPSKMFLIQNQLNAVNADALQQPTGNQIINFGILENPAYLTNSQGVETLSNIQYRCVFLPNNTDLVRGLLTAEELKYIDEEVKDRVQLEKLYAEKIAVVKSQIAALKNEATAEKVEQPTLKNVKGTTAKKTSKANTAGITIAERMALLNIQLEILEKELVVVKENKGHLQPGFFFNLTTAEQIPAGSYTLADKGKDTLIAYLLSEIDDINEKLGEDNLNKLNTSILALVKNKSTSDDTEKFIQKVITSIENTIKEVLNTTLKSLLNDFGQLVKDLIQLSKGYTFYSKQVTLAAETTDNFGNRLINGNAYIPAIVSITNNPDETVNAQFINALSDFQHTAQFIYNDPYASKDTIVSYPKQTTLNQS